MKAIHDHGVTVGEHWDYVKWRRFYVDLS